MRDRLTSLVLALLAIAIFVAMFFQGEAKIATSMPHTEDRGEQGLAGFYAWLAARGVNVHSHRRRWHELPQGEGLVLMTHAPYREMNTDTRTWRDAPRAYQENRERKGLVRWVAMGNTLVIAQAAADPDAPEFYQRDQERAELGYTRVLQAFGWDSNSQTRDGDDGDAYDTSANPNDSESADDATLRDANDKSDDAKTQAPRSKAQQKVDAPIASDPNARTQDPIISDPLKASPSALHRLVLDLPGQKLLGAQPLAIEHLTWSSQEGQASGMYRNQGDTFGRECLPPPRDDLASEEDYDDDVAYDDEYEGRIDNAETHAADTDTPIVASPNSEARDYASDEILADGSTLDSSGKRTYPLCNLQGLSNALPLLRSQRDGSAQGWWAPFGKGRLIVLPYGGLFRNRSLHQADNARAGQAILQRFQAPNARIYFDDYRYGLSDVYDPEAFYRDPRLYKSVAIAVLLWLMYAVGRRSRLLPVRLARPRFSSAQMAINLSEFYARKLDPKELAEQLILHFERALALRYGADNPDSTSVFERVQRRLAALGTAPATLEKLRLLSQGDSNAALTELIDALAHTLRLDGLSPPPNPPMAS